MQEIFTKNAADAPPRRGIGPGGLSVCFCRKRLTIRKNVYILNLSNRYGKGLGAMKVYISYPHFSTWNIDNGATSFRNQTSEDYDPKLHELLGLLKHSGG